MKTIAAAPRPDAWWAGLSEEDWWAVYDRRKAGQSWQDVTEFVGKQYGIPVSHSMLGRFFDWMRKAESALILVSVKTAKDIAGGIARVDVDPKLAADALTALSLDAATQRNDEAMKILADAAAKYHAVAQGAEKLRLDAARQRTAEETLRLSREKFEAAQRREEAAKETIADAKLSPEEREARLKAIFGM